VQRALFYVLRISIAKGNSVKAEQAMKDMDSLLNEMDYPNRFATHDIITAWYFYFLRMPKKVPDWLKDEFTTYGHAYFIENFGNQAKARYHYLTKDYPSLLAYIVELRQRESVLFGRIEMMAMEACVYFKMKNREKAYAVLQEAYETASPNDIKMPFIELGRDMRTLIAAAMRMPGINIPRPWLESIGKKSASYAKHQAKIIEDYRFVNHVEDDINLSKREFEILLDLYNGLSRTQIAADRNISINTVKMRINIIYAKLHANNVADLIRIAVERKIV
jgi:LuxR family maltose regulon positive regulatory protein